MWTGSEAKAPAPCGRPAGGSWRVISRDKLPVSLRVSATLLAILLALSACTPAHTVKPEEQVYHSIWAELYPGSLQRELDHGTLQGAFNFAAAAETQTTAEQRWASFLTTWKPANGEFEDAMQANLVTWAELEMQRLQSLRQNDLSALKAIDDKLRSLATDLQ